MTTPNQILEAARTILLVDWPNPDVPRALLGAGFTVFSFCPNRYSAVELVADRPQDVDDKNFFPPMNENDIGYLVFRQLASRPDAVDIVSIYRPIEELAGIVTDHVLLLGAKALWLQTPVTPAEAAMANRLANQNGLVFVAGDIAKTARMVNSGG